jgi:hypothetical protein
METLRHFAALIAGKQVSLSLAEFVCFVLFISLCLLFRRHRLGLFITYCFIIYWGFVMNGAYFVDILNNTLLGLPIYVLLGIIMIVLGIFSLARSE